MKYGLKDNYIEKIQSVFAVYPAIDMALLYGSRAKGNYKTSSDIDISLVGDELDLSLILRIENELDDLLLPYSIDLSIFNKIENIDLVEHIKRVGIVLYERNKS